MTRDGVFVKIVETGEVFDSIQACADYLGVNVSWLGKVVRGSDRLYTVHGYHIVKIDDDVDIDDLMNRRGRPGIRVKVTETNEIYQSITECANAIGGSPGAIHDVLHNNRRRRTHKGMHFELV